MKAIAKNLGLLAASSMVAIAISLVTAKAAAVTLGPTGVGYLSLVQSLLSLCTLIASIGIGAGLVKSVAAALADRDVARISSLYRAAWIVTLCLALIAFGVLLLARAPIAEVAFGGTRHSGDVPLIGLAAGIGLLVGVQTNYLNAHHRVAALALCGIVVSGSTAACMIVAIVLVGTSGIAPALIAGAVGSWIVSTVILRRTVDLPRIHPPIRSVIRHAGSLLRFGGPYTGSMLVGGGVQLILPIIVLHNLNAANVGYYRAAMTIAGTYLGFLLSAMAQDYFPRMASVAREPARMCELVNQQHRLVVFVGTPIIMAAVALAPIALPLIYTSQFAGATQLLQWQLTGDVFKLSAWSMSFVILCRARSSTYFLLELTGGVVMLGGSWAGMTVFGLTGLGVGYLFAYVAYDAVALIAAHREIGLVLSRSNCLTLLGAAVAILVVRLLFVFCPQLIASCLGLLLAIPAAAFAVHVIRRESAIDSPRTLDLSA